jgi:hypothetical protein
MSAPSWRPAALVLGCQLAAKRNQTIAAGEFINGHALSYTRDMLAVDALHRVQEIILDVNPSRHEDRHIRDVVQTLVPGNLISFVLAAADHAHAHRTPPAAEPAEQAGATE